MVQNVRTLERKRQAVVRRIPCPATLLKGSLVMMRRVCGQPNCRCARGEKHASLYLSRYCRGKPTMWYVSKDQEPQVKQAVANYRALMKWLNELSGLTLELLQRQR